MNLVELTTEIYGQTPPKELMSRLYLVDKLCGRAGGTLVSRQLIATIVEQYMREQESDA